MFGAFHGGLVALGFATFARGVPTEQLPVVTTSASPASSMTLRVATLNLAQGRSISGHRGPRPKPGPPIVGTPHLSGARRRRSRFRGHRRPFSPCRRPTVRHCGAGVSIGHPSSLWTWEPTPSQEAAMSTDLVFSTAPPWCPSWRCGVRTRTRSRRAHQHRPRAEWSLRWCGPQNLSSPEAKFRSSPSTWISLVAAFGPARSRR